MPPLIYLDVIMESVRSAPDLLDLNSIIQADIPHRFQCEISSDSQFKRCTMNHREIMLLCNPDTTCRHVYFVNDNAPTACPITVIPDIEDLAEVCESATILWKPEE